MEFNVSLANRINAKVMLPSPMQVVGITGPSGAGKSTLLRALAGFEPQAKVSVNWFGKNEVNRTRQNTASSSTKAESRLVAKYKLKPKSPSTAKTRSTMKENSKFTPVRVGLVFQQPMLFPHVDVKGNLLLAQRHAGANALAIDDALSGCEALHLLHKPINGLSGGEAQRVAIARALVNGPDVLLLDESMSALDTHLRMKILRFLVKTTAMLGIKLVMVSHDLHDLALFCDGMIVMKEGQVSSAGSAASTMSFIASHEPLENPCAVIEGRMLPPSDDFPYPFTRIKVGDSILFTKSYTSHIQNRDDQVNTNAAMMPEQAQDNGRIVVFASEISLDINAQVGTPTSSMLNALPCEIVDICCTSNDHNHPNDLKHSTAPKNPTAIVVLMHEQQTLYASVSTLSLARLQLTVGLRVVARFKLQ